MKSYSQTAYEAYARYVGGEQTEWVDLGTKERDAWLAAAQAVTEQWEKSHVPIS